MRMTWIIDRFIQVPVYKCPWCMEEFSDSLRTTVEEWIACPECGKEMEE